MNCKSHDHPSRTKTITLALAGVAGRRRVAATAGLLLVATAFGGSASAQRLPAIVSINTCTDQIALALAEPSQILGLSRFSRHAEMSFLAVKAAGFPKLRGAAEEVLKLRPDVVLAGAFSGRSTREALIANGVRVETFAPPRSIDEAKAEIGRVAQLVGQEARGASMIGEIQQAQARLAQAARGRPPLGVIAVQRRTFVSGRMTLISDVLETAGLRNIATRLGIESIGQVSLEALLKAAPDALVLEGLEGAPDQSTAVLHHPVLVRAFPAERRIVVPVAEVTCGGPALVALMDRIGAAAARLPAR